MSFGDAVKTCLGKYVDFSGRARRSEYWWFFLFNVLVGVVGYVIDAALGTYPLFYALVALALFLPGLAAAVRRLHDTGRSGWWYLIALVPCIGFIVFIVFAVQDSGPDNQYGPNPKTTGAGYAV